MRGAARSTGTAASGGFPRVPELVLSFPVKSGPVGAIVDAGGVPTISG